MNITQAEAISSLYEELIKAVPRDRLEPPKSRWSRGTPSIDTINIEDGMVKVSWSLYVGCGETEDYTTYHRLDELFE